MSEMRSILVESAARLFERLCTRPAFELAERFEWQPQVWDALEAADLPRATRSEARGGAGADLGDALALVRAAGDACLPAPLAETLLAELALGAAGLDAMPGPLTVAPVIATDRLELTERDDAWELSGTLRRVPWARHAHAIVVIASAGGRNATVVVEKPAISARNANYANEPRDDLHFDRLHIPKNRVSLEPAGLSPERLHALGAAFRSAAMAGALNRVLGMTVRYAQERQQFGRPIGKFQAVQQQIAVLASEVAAASAAVDALLDAVSAYAADFEIAASKARVGEAAGIVSGIAHQVHAAIGFTHEHALHRSTRRLWSWRDEFGSEVEWAGWVGRCAARIGNPESLWSFISAEQKVLPAGMASAGLSPSQVSGR